MHAAQKMKKKKTPKLIKTLKSIYYEYRYLRGDKGCGKDPFECVKNKRFRRWYWDTVLKGRLPTGVELEINTHCNRRCSYCPNLTKMKPARYMNDEDYKKIIDELAQYNYRGELSPSFYGEPMMDKRIYRFMEYARKKLAKATIIINTNGDFLTPENLMQLSENGVDLFFVSQHDPEPSSAIKRICDYVKDRPALKSKVAVTNWTAPSRMLSNRGGLVEDRRVRFMPKYGCFRSRRVTITYDGSMVMCCEDFASSFVFGNVLKNEFMNIWQDGLKLRKEIFLGNYTEPICRICSGRKNGNAI